MTALARRLLAALVVGVCCTATADAAVPAAERRAQAPGGSHFSYPASLHLERSHSPSFVMISVAEVTVANFPLRSPIVAHHSSRGSSMRIGPARDPAGRFPADGVAFRVLLQQGGPAMLESKPETRFPLRLSSLRRMGADAYGRSVEADGVDLSLEAWIGPRASANARADLARMVSSFAVPRLRPGERIGEGLTVLQPARSYPVGSFTRLRVQGQPFYLVHAPGGFYGIGWTWESLAGGYKSRCALRLDEATKQFYCRNMRSRWDRIGRPLERPAGARRADPLNVAVATVSWDGHVLLAAGTAGFADSAEAHRFWPAVYRR